MIPETRQAVKTVKLWEVSSGKQVKEFKGHSDYVYSVSFSSDGKFIVSGSKDKTVKLWNAIGALRANWKRNITDIYSVVYSPDGKLIATGSKNKNQLILWDAINGDVKISFSFRGSIVCFSPDGNYLVAGYDTLELWDIKNNQRERKFHGYKENISALSFSPNGKLLVSGHTNGDVYILGSTHTGTDWAGYAEHDPAPAGRCGRRRRAGDALAVRSLVRR